MLHKIGRGIFFEAPLDAGPSDLERVFDANGKLAKFNPTGYSVRDSQVQLARATHTALTTKRHLLAEAPCGVGKSIGYAVPAILTRESRKRVVLDVITGLSKVVYDPVIIVTANIALQEQLINKDLPMLREALGVPFTYGLLKGRANYVCNAQLDYGAYRDTRDDAATQGLVDLVETWADHTQTGDKSEFDIEIPSHVWRRFSMSNEECAGSSCAYFEQCRAYGAQRRALGSDIVVTNYHTLFSDIALQQTVGVCILPPEAPLILDEAHEAAEIARDILGGSLTLGNVLAALSSAAKAGLCARSQYDSHAFDVFNLLTQHARSKSYAKRLKQPAMPGTLPLGELLAALAERALADLTAGGLTPHERTVLQSANRRAGNAARMLKIIHELPEMYAVALDLPRDDKGTEFVAVDVRVVEPGEILATSMFRRPAVVMTSATLTTQHSFSLVQTELGVPRDLTDYADLPSPFDFQKQAMLVVPDTLPVDPNSDEFREAMAEAVCETVRLARGRTLGLFTSYRNLRLAADALRRQKCPYRVLQQGDAPRTMLTQQFRDDESSVLLGTTSFWTGVDVAGASLSCLLIDKLPFPEVNNPVMDALSDKYDDWFQRFSLPRAIMMFRQGAGRLIRSATDKGVIVVLDQRIRTKNYGAGFIQSLPPMRVSKNLADIRTMI